MRLVNSAVFLGMVTAYLFCVSTAYTHGYFHTLGLDSDLLERSFHQTLYSGFLLSISNIFFISFYFFVFMLIIMAFCGLRDTSRNKGGCFYRFEKKVIKWLGGPNVGEEIKQPVIMLFFKSIIIFLFVLILFTILSAYESNGVESAKLAINKIKNGNITEIYLDGGKDKMAYLYCGGKICAGYSLEDHAIKYFPYQKMTLKTDKFK